MKKHHVLTLLTLLWIAFIFLQSLQSGDVSSNTSGRIVLFLSNIINSVGLHIEFNTLSLLVRKFAHFFEYAILGILLIYTLQGFGFESFQNMFLVLILGLSIAIIDELIQTFVDGRHGSMGDVGIDFLGLLFVTILIHGLQHKKKKNRST